MTRYCTRCKKTLDEKEFYKSLNLEKYPDGKLNMCKQCITAHIDNWDPDTYLWILEEADVPYIKLEWNNLLKEWGDKATNVTILGRYLAKMKLRQWNKYRWADTEKLEEEAVESRIESMKTQGMTMDEIKAELAVDTTPPKPERIVAIEAAQSPEYYDPESEEDEISDQLTEEDKLMLTLKWGRGYRWEEKVRMEQLYNDMMASYDIQGAGHKDTLILICKTSLKANQLIDAGDVDNFQKMQKAYDSLMKSGKFTAAQNKGESGEYVDSISELVVICEKEGFIPRYYVDKPKDRVDETLRDLQEYTHILVTEETNLTNMIESSMHQIEEDRRREAIINVDDSDDEYDSIMGYNDGLDTMTMEDYEEFRDFLDETGDDDDGAS